MSIFRASNHRHTLHQHGTRISTDAETGWRAFEEDLLEGLEFAWSWGMAQAFREAVEKKFSVHIHLCAKYQKGLLGSCAHQDEERSIVKLRPTMRGLNAWQTFFHELAHAITGRLPHDVDCHGKKWKDSLVVIHEFWKGFIKTLEGELHTRLIEMVTNYGYWRGRPIGMDENTDPWNRPWIQRQ